MDVQCDKLATVVGRTKLTILATVDVGLTTLASLSPSVHLCVQYDVRRALHLLRLIYCYCLLA